MARRCECAIACRQVRTVAALPVPGFMRYAMRRIHSSDAHQACIPFCLPLLVVCRGVWVAGAWLSGTQAPHYEAVSVNACRRWFTSSEAGSRIRLIQRLCCRVIIYVVLKAFGMRVRGTTRHHAAGPRTSNLCWRPRRPVYEVMRGDFAEIIFVP